MSLKLKNSWSFQGKDDDGQDRWDWEAFIDGPTEELKKVASVDYVLHPTFRNPLRTIENPENGFRMKTSGWGIFTLRAFVNKRDGAKVKLEHPIVLKRTPPIGVSE